MGWKKHIDRLDATAAVGVLDEEPVRGFTLLFGFLEIAGVTIHGVWRGKDGFDWRRERSKLEFRSTNLGPQLERDRSIVETYEELSEE